MHEILAFEFVQNAVAAGLLASLLCGLVGTFVVVKRLVFVSGGVSHAAFGGLGVFYYLGLAPLAGAALAALVAAVVLSARPRSGGRSRDAVIGILWAVGMAVGVVFIARTPGYAPNLAGYLFGDILAVSRPLIVALALLVVVVLAVVSIFFKELVAVAFDEEFARSRGVATRAFLLVLMALIAISVVLLIQVVGAMLAIALLTIPPVISLSLARGFRSAMLLAIAIGALMTLGGLALSLVLDLPSGPTIVLLGFGTLLLVAAARRLRSGRRPGLAALTIAAFSLLAIRPADGVATENEAAVTLPFRHLELLGEARIDLESYAGVPLGGLSGLAYDAATDRYYAVSDDRAERGPARFYTLAIDLADGRLAAGGVEVLAVTRLTTADGRDFGAGRIDPEAIALTPRGTLIIASEGDARIELAPFLREFTAEGMQRRDFPLPRRYAPRSDGQSGVRYNLALESAALAPGGRFLFSATESALAQDGPPSDLRNASPGRILQYDLERRRLVAEYLYWIDPVAEPTRPAGEFSTAGVVDILALDETTLLVLERSFSVGRGNDVRLYLADLDEATDIAGIEALARHGFEDIRPVRKRLLLHIDRLGIEPDNLEGMTLGPKLPDGRPTLVLVSDDNFNRERQVSQILAFALGDSTPTIAEIQGRGHHSALAGDWLVGVTGTVTAIDAGPEGGFWLQTPDGAIDGDEGTSEALFVRRPAPAVAVGDSVRLDGAVRELGSPGGLTVTSLDAARVEILGSNRTLPAPQVLGEGGRRLPRVVIDDDRLERFDPCCDAIDYFESLEGMRVEVRRPTAVSGTTRYGEIAVLADDGDGSRPRSARGGVLLRPGDPNPERILLDDRVAAGPTPDVEVGQSFLSPVRGVVDYAFGNFRVQVDSWPPISGTLAPGTRPRPDALGELSIATYNVLNLDALDDATKYARLATTIVAELGAPAILGLQEIQDDNGAADDGVVSARRTLARLIEAIERTGGPRYVVRQIDPEHNADGGQPNGNIRVAWLLDPRRARPIDRPAGASSGSTESEPPSPLRIAPDSPGFAGDPERGWPGSRKCLALDAVTLTNGREGESLLLVNCHLKSKRGDDRLFGPVQPPIFHTREQRTGQVREIRRFVGRRLADDPAAAIVVLGDMNDHEFEPPMRLLARPPLVALTERVPPEERYSFNFNGNSQLLDHILVSPALAPRVTDLTIVHLNADAPASRRASDHDPVLLRLRLD